MPQDHARQLALQKFAQSALNCSDLRIEPASSDASFRSYWRVLLGDETYIVMDSPPQFEDVKPWLDICERLRFAGLHAPEVFAQDLQQGFLLIADLGTQTYLPTLNDETVDALYADAMHALLGMQIRVDCEGLPHYDEQRLTAELELFPKWFLQEHLQIEIECEEWDIIERAFRYLLNSALEQPKAFVHRDFHSRNLMITEHNNPGLIDFQDAVVGPITYDLVSLLRDCYIRWPESKIADWSNQHRQQLVNAGVIKADEIRWQRWIDWMGLQRHIKVLGIFCRLNYRDGKASYLCDLPLVLSYTLDIASQYPELKEFSAWLLAKTSGRELTAARQP